MRYVCSDPHGEYEAFRAALDAVKFSDRDVLYICGDVIDKGKEPIRLWNFIRAQKNIRCIMGNHEWALLHEADAYKERGLGREEVLARLRERYVSDGQELTQDSLDDMRALPFYLEEEDFICVHAGLPFRSGVPVHPSAAQPEELLFDRRFKERKATFSDKCVFFGHTPTRYLYNEDKVVAYKKPGVKTALSVGDYCKVHLDLGSDLSHTIGLFCIDTLFVTYAKITDR
ncbi:MAG: metallophosphoesterase [Clostridia bacterium]|nr:metallophosphoesterase [Clostridia bacterium]